jgi:hypothetical protein
VKEIANELARLGTDISASFAEKIGQWGFVATQERLPAAELSGLFALGEDLERFQTALQDFEDMETAFQGNFYPDFQTQIPENQPETPEIGQDEKRVARRLENFPFTAGSPLPFYKTPQMPPKSPAHAGAERFETPASGTAHKPENVWQRPETAQNNGNIPLPETNAGARRNGATNRGDFQNEMPRLDLPEARFWENKSIENKNIEGQGIKKMPPQTPPTPPDTPFFQNPDTAFPQGQKNTTPEISDDIWRRPLQNLGGFASGFSQYPASPTPEKNETKPVQNPQNENVVKPDRSYPAPESTPEKTILQTPPMPPVRMPDQTEWEESRVPTLQTHSLDDPFDQTEDLLEALTRRIARDFKRYYP